MSNRLPFFRAPLLALALTLNLLSPAQAQGDDVLAVLPSAQQVVADMKGNGSRDSAARATAALQVMEGLVTGLAGSRAAAKQFTAAERRRIEDYGNAQREIWGREYDRQPACEGEGCARYLYAKCAQAYYFSAPFYRELIDRYLPPAWAASHVPKLPGQLWKTALALPPGTRAPATLGSSLPCTGAAQALLQAAREGALMDQLGQAVLGPRATRDNPRYRAFLAQAVPALVVGLGLLALWLLAYLRQFGKRLALDPADPTRLRAPGSHELHLATGTVAGTSKGIQTITTTYTENNRVTGQSSQTVVHDQFFVREPDGTEHAVQLKGHDLAVHDGQVMSLVWAGRAGQKGGRYLLLRNHSLRSNTHFERNQDELLGVRQRYTWLTLLTLLGLTVFLALSVDWWIKGEGATLIAVTLGPLSVIVPLVMGIVLGLSRRARLRAFRRDLDERLVPELDRRTAAH